MSKFFAFVKSTALKAVELAKVAYAKVVVFVKAAWARGLSNSEINVQNSVLAACAAGVLFVPAVTKFVAGVLATGGLAVTVAAGLAIYVACLWVLSCYCGQVWSCLFSKKEQAAEVTVAEPVAAQ